MTNIRAEFFAWVDDQGCDTDGAWSAWQAAYEAGRLAGMIESVDALQAAVVNGEIPAMCEEAADWLENNRAAASRKPA